MGSTLDLSYSTSCYVLPSEGEQGSIVLSGNNYVMGNVEPEVSLDVWLGVPTFVTCFSYSNHVSYFLGEPQRLE